MRPMTSATGKGRVEAKPGPTTSSRGGSDVPCTTHIVLVGECVGAHITKAVCQDPGGSGHHLGEVYGTEEFPSASETLFGDD